MLAEVPGFTLAYHRVNKEGGWVFQSSRQSPEIHSDDMDIGDTPRKMECSNWLILIHVFDSLETHESPVKREGSLKGEA